MFIYIYIIIIISHDRPISDTFEEAERALSESEQSSHEHFERFQKDDPAVQLLGPRRRKRKSRQLRDNESDGKIIIE